MLKNKLCCLFTKKLIFLILCAVFALSAYATYIIYQKFSADEYIDTRMNISVRLYDSTNQKSVEGATVKIRSSRLDTDKENYEFTLTTGPMGEFNFTLPNDNYDQIHVEKLGYFDLDGSVNFDSTTSGPKEVSFALVLDPGFGVQNIHLQTIMPGTNWISTPVILENSDPETFLKYYIAGTGKNGYQSGIMPTIGRLAKLPPSTGGELILSKSNLADFGYIDPHTGYSINNTGQIARTVVLKGKEPASGGNIELTKNHINSKTFIGVPLDAPKSLNETSVKIGEETFTLIEAMSSGTITSFTGWDNKSQRQIVYSDKDRDALLRPGFSFKIETASDQSAIVFDATSKDPNVIEAPSFLTLEDMQWAFWVDKDNLDDKTFPVWSYIVNSLIEASNQSLLHTTNYDSVINYSKNGKVVPSLQPDDVPLPVPINANQVSSTSATASPAASNNDCVILDKTYKLCVLFPGQWQPNSKDALFDVAKSAYPKIKEVYGPPLLSSKESVKKINVALNNLSITDAAGNFSESLNIITLYTKYVDVNRWNSGDRSTVIHEMIHSFRDDYIHYTGKDVSWEEGHTSYATYLVQELLSATDTKYLNELKNVKDISALYAQYNHPALAVKNSESNWKDGPFAGFFYLWSASAWAQIYDLNNSFFKSFNQNLLAGKNYRDSIAGLADQVGTESFDNWYQKNYGLMQAKNNRYSGKQIPRITTNITSTNLVTEITTGLIGVKNLEGKISEEDHTVDIGVYMPVDSGSGNKENKMVDVACSSSFAGNHVLKIDTKEAGKRYTIASLINSKRNERFTNITYVALPLEGAGIYGTAPDIIDGIGTVTIEPLSPNKLEAKPIDIVNGYFDDKKIGDPRYGYNAGSYKISYRTNNVSKTYTITKDKGKRFLPIRMGKGSHSLSFSDIEKRVGIRPAYDGLYALINYKTANPSFGILLYKYLGNSVLKTGSFGDYGSNFFGTIVPGQKYFFKILAIDQSGKNDPVKSLATIPEEENFDPAFYLGSDEIGLTAFEITDISAISSSTSTTISWNTSVPTKGKVCYGETTDYGTCTDLTETFTSDHKIIINDLIFGRTYHYQIYSESEDKTTARSDDASFAIGAIDDISVTPYTTSAVIAWRTPEINTTGVVKYGSSDSYGMSQPTEPTPKQDHSLTITGLTPNTDYHFQIEARNGDGTLVSSDQIFRTSKYIDYRYGITGLEEKTLFPPPDENKATLDFKTVVDLPVTDMPYSTTVRINYRCLTCQDANPQDMILPPNTRHHAVFSDLLGDSQYAYDIFIKDISNQERLVNSGDFWTAKAFLDLRVEIPRYSNDFSGSVMKIGRIQLSNSSQGTYFQAYYPTNQSMYIKTTADNIHRIVIVSNRFGDSHGLGNDVNNNAYIDGVEWTPISMSALDFPIALSGNLSGVAPNYTINGSHSFKIHNFIYFNDGARKVDTGNLSSLYGYSFESEVHGCPRVWEVGVQCSPTTLFVPQYSENQTQINSVPNVFDSSANRFIMTWRADQPPLAVQSISLLNTTQSTLTKATSEVTNIVKTTGNSVSNIFRRISAYFNRMINSLRRF